MKNAPTVTLDGNSVPITEVETQLFNIVMPENNLFNNPPANPVPGGTAGNSVAHGWAALLHPLTPGTHTIVIGGNVPENTTTIEVTPGH